MTISASRPPQRLNPRLSLIRCMLALGAVGVAGQAHALSFGPVRVTSGPGPPSGGSGWTMDYAGGKAPRADPRAYSDA